MKYEWSNDSIGRYSISKSPIIPRIALYQAFRNDLIALLCVLVPCLFFLFRPKPANVTSCDSDHNRFVRSVRPEVIHLCLCDSLLISFTRLTWCSRYTDFFPSLCLCRLLASFRFLGLMFSLWSSHLRPCLALVSLCGDWIACPTVSLEIFMYSF